MDEFWLNALGVYGVATGITLLIGMLMVDNRNSWIDRRRGARVLFLCWAWPFLLAYAAGVGVAKLWALADWGRW